MLLQQLSDIWVARPVFLASLEECLHLIMLKALFLWVVNCIIVCMHYLCYFLHCGHNFVLRVVKCSEKWWNLKQENDLTTTGLVSDRPDVTGKSTISDVKNKNVSSMCHSDEKPSSQQLLQTRKEIAAAAESAALKWVDSIISANFCGISNVMLPD